MPRLPDCRIVGSELIIRYTSHGDAMVGCRSIRDAMDAAEKAVASPEPPSAIARWRGLQTVGRHGGPRHLPFDFPFDFPFGNIRHFPLGRR